jgi:hypothetical protein
MFDSGAGPELVIGGLFSSVEGVPASCIARRTSSGWAPLGPGVNQEVSDLAVFDDAGGHALYVGGPFTFPARGLARWSGSEWSSVAGFTGVVRKLAVALLDGRPNLYVIGDQLKVNGESFGRIARFDGNAWRRMPNIGGISDVTVTGDGPTQTLVAVGCHLFFSNISLGQVAFWNGSHWSGLHVGENAGCTSIAVGQPDEQGRTPLWIGGSFTHAGPGAALNIARVDLCALHCDGDVDASRVVDFTDLNSLLSSFGSDSPHADFNGDGVVNLPDLLAVLTAFGSSC